MSAWVSKEWVDDTSGKQKRRRGKTSPGVRGIKDSDKFLVCFYDPSGRLKQERIKLAGKPGKRLADRRAEQITAQLTLNEYQSRNDATWADFRADLDRRFVSEKAQSTQDSYNDALDLFERICKPKWMRTIHTAAVADFRAGLRQRPGRKGGKVAPTSVNKHLRHLKAALRQAHKWDYLERLPEVEMLREPEKETVYMIPEHFEAIYLACDAARYPSDRHYEPVDWWRAVMITGLMTGMRIYEMMTLPWDDAHLDEGYLVVRHDEAKGKRDDVIPLHPVAVAHLKRIQDVGLHLFDWPLQKRALIDHWHMIQRASGIHLTCHDNRVGHECTPTCHVYGFHSLKKACGTLNAARVPETVLNAFMRHASPTTTKKFYQDKRRVVEGHVDSLFVPEVALQNLHE